MMESPWWQDVTSPRSAPTRSQLQSGTSLSGSSLYSSCGMVFRMVPDSSRSVIFGMEWNMPLQIDSSRGLLLRSRLSSSENIVQNEDDGVMLCKSLLSLKSSDWRFENCFKFSQSNSLKLLWLKFSFLNEVSWFLQSWCNVNFTKKFSDKSNVSSSLRGSQLYSNSSNELCLTVRLFRFLKSWKFLNILVPFWQLTRLRCSRLPRNVQDSSDWFRWSQPNKDNSVIVSPRQESTSSVWFCRFQQETAIPWSETKSKSKSRTILDIRDIYLYPDFCIPVQNQLQLLPQLIERREKEGK